MSQRHLTDEDVRALVEAFHAYNAVPAGVHADHHEFIERLIAREKRKQELWDKVKAHVIGWGAVALIGATVATFGQWIIDGAKHLVGK